MPDTDIWEAVRKEAFWQDVILPALHERQQEIFRALCKAQDERTMHLLQGGAAELETLIGNPEKEAARKARQAEHAENAPEERTKTDGRRDARRPADRARRLAERRL